MNVSNLITTKWLNNYNNWLPFVQWAGWLLAVILLAKIVWLWVLIFSAPSEFQPIRVDAVASTSTNHQTDVSALLNINLFGNHNAPKVETKEPQKKVAETKLNLKLRGIYASDTESKANAIVEDNRGRQAVYFIGEKLEVSGRVFLRQVFIDRIILDTNGTEESLRLEQEEMAIHRVKDEPSRDREDDDAEARIRDERQNDQLSEKLSDYRDQFREDPTSVSDVISGRPHFVDGQLQGIVIQPGKDKRLFQELGLRNDDVVTAINGVQLNNMADAMSLMNDADSLQELNVEIRRDGQPVNLLLNLNDRAGKE